MLDVSIQLILGFKFLLMEKFKNSVSRQQAVDDGDAQTDD
jgi:hypothetical protein